MATEYGGVGSIGNTSQKGLPLDTADTQNHHENRRLGLFFLVQSVNLRKIYLFEYHAEQNCRSPLYVLVNNCEDAPSYTCFLNGIKLNQKVSDIPANALSSNPSCIRVPAKTKCGGTC